MGLNGTGPMRLPRETWSMNSMAQHSTKQQVTPVAGEVMPPELYLNHPRSQRERIVYGTNEPVSPEFLKQAMVGWLSFLGGVGLLLFLMALGLEWKMGVVFTIYLLSGVAATIVMWRVVLPYMTGDNVAEKEIAKERDVELRHIDAHKEVALKWLNVQDKLADVELEKVRFQQDQLDISQRLARLEQAQLDSLHMLPADRGRSFVPARDQSAKLKVHKWVDELYETEGAITSSGKIRMKMPQWSKEEERYIMELFVAPTRNGEWWEVVHGDKFSALSALNNMDKGA